MAISLQDMQQFYKDNLENRIFRYMLRGGQIIELTFGKENLCHLLGIQHVFPKDREYIGIKGYRKIEDGELTVGLLRKHNLAQFKKMKYRISKFMEIANLLITGSIYRFYFLRQRESEIGADYIVYGCSEDCKMYCNLFIAKERSLLLNDKKNKAYIPLSYVVMRENDDYDKYVRNQEYKEVENFQVIMKN